MDKERENEFEREEFLKLEKGICPTCDKRLNKINFHIKECKTCKSIYTRGTNRSYYLKSTYAQPK